MFLRTFSVHVSPMGHSYMQLLWHAYIQWVSIFVHLYSRDTQTASTYTVVHHYVVSFAFLWSLHIF